MNLFHVLCPDRTGCDRTGLIYSQTVSAAAVETDPRCGGVVRCKAECPRICPVLGGSGLPGSGLLEITGDVSRVSECSALYRGLQDVSDHVRRLRTDNLHGPAGAPLFPTEL